MRDFFALLGESPRPWLDPEALKAKYHQLTAERHPDVAGASVDFADINRAYQTLADPAARLRHLLDLESAGAISRLQPVPEEIAVFFGPVAQASQAVETIMKRYAGAASPLAKALLSTERYRAQERLEQVIAELQEKQTALLSRVREVDELWDTDRASALRRVPELWQALGYTAKWLGTLRESLFQMASQ